MTTLIVSEVRRGELWIADFGEPLGHEQGWTRPFLVVSSDEWNRHASVLTGLPLTRTRRGLPTRIEIEPDDENRLDVVSYARCEDIRSISERRLLHRIGTSSPAVMAVVGRTIRRFLEI